MVVRPFRDHLRAHGHVHSIWTISILLLIICAMLLGLVDGEKISDYIAFAASIASLVLALVAIFYSIVSNQSFAETVGSLKSSSSEIETSAGDLCRVTEDLSEQSKLLLSEVSTLSPQFKSVSDKIDRLSPNQVEGTDERPPRITDGQGVSLSSREMAIGLRMTLYSIGLSHFNKKPIDAQSALSDKNWGNFIGGALSAINEFRPLGIKLLRSNNEKKRAYSVESIGSITIEELLAQGSMVSAEYIKNIKSELDNYFCKLDEQEQSSDQAQSVSQNDDSSDSASKDDG